MSGTQSEELIKSEITKGALYLFDDAFRKRAGSPAIPGMPREMRVKIMATVSETEPVMGTYLREYRSFENGLAILGEIVKHPENSMWDVCQLLFNNKNGIRYVYRDELEQAKKISK